MKIKGITTEDFVNYKEPSLFLAIGSCQFKCCKEAGIPIETCQNSALAKSAEKDIDYSRIYDLYINNPITKAVVIGGMEPITQFHDIVNLLEYFRTRGCHDPFVIYTGYYPHEIKKQLYLLKKYDTIIMKFGRYVPDNEPHYDEVLGVNLVSDNQYGEVIS